MAAYNKFQDYAEQVNKAIHNWSAHVFKCAFSNAAPSAANTLLSDITQIATAGGYTGGAGGGVTLDGVTLTEAAGTAKVVITDEVFTAAGASVGPMRYFAIYNDSATSPLDALVCWFDYGAALTLLDTESLTIDFDATNGLWQFA